MGHSSLGDKKLAVGRGIGQCGSRGEQAVCGQGEIRLYGGRGMSGMGIQQSVGRRLCGGGEGGQEN